MFPRLCLNRWLPLTIAVAIALGLAITNTSRPAPPVLAAEDLGSWNYALARLPVPTGEVAVVELDGYIYAIGGITASGRTTNVWRYNPADDAVGWVQRASFDPPGLDHAMAAAYGGKIYLFGGLTGWPFNSVDTVFEYDPAKNSWTRKAPMPQINGALGLGAGGIAVLGDKIYVAGGANRSGRNARQALAALLAYSPASDSWDTSLPSMPTRRDHLVLVALDGKLHAIGGRDIDLSKVTNAHEIYDPATRTWKTSKRAEDNVAPLPVARAGLGGGVLNGRIVVFGGEINGSSPQWGVFPNTDEYDPRTNSWLRLGDLPRLPEQPQDVAGRHGTNGAVIENVLYVPAGSIKQGNAFTGVTAAFSRTLALPPTTTATTPSSPTETSSVTPSETSPPANTTPTTSTTATSTATETSTVTPSRTPQPTDTTATDTPTVVPTVAPPATAPQDAQAWIPLLIK